MIKNTRMKNLKKKSTIMLYLLPALLIYTVFMAYPLISSLNVSLYNWSGIGDMTFAGLQNFKDILFKKPYNTRFFGALGNNIKFFIWIMIVQNVIALMISFLISKKGLKGAKIYRTILFIPVTLSVVIVGFIWTLILNPNWGVINSFLNAVGLHSLAKPWLGDPKYALLAIGVANAWQYIGLPIMLFLASIESIPEELFEAARIDGCGNVKIIRYITLPGMSSTIGLVTILTFTGNFTGFDIIYAMASSSAGPNYSSDILGTLFYRTAFGAPSGVSSMGQAAAIAVFMVIILSIGVYIWLRSNYKSYKV